MTLMPADIDDINWMTGCCWRLGVSQNHIGTMVSWKRRDKVPHHVVGDHIGRKMAQCHCMKVKKWAHPPLCQRLYYTSHLLVAIVMGGIDCELHSKPKTPTESPS